MRAEAKPYPRRRHAIPFEATRRSRRPHGPRHVAHRGHSGSSPTRFFKGSTTAIRLAWSTAISSRRTCSSTATAASSVPPAPQIASRQSIQRTDSRMHTHARAHAGLPILECPRSSAGTMRATSAPSLEVRPRSSHRRSPPATRPSQGSRWTCGLWASRFSSAQAARCLSKDRHSWTSSSALPW